MLYNPKWEVVVKDGWRRVLLRAAELIEYRGLCKNRFADPNGSICLIEACQIAARELGLDINPYGPPCHAILRYTGADSVIVWTDAKERTQAEAVAALRGAAGLD